MWYKYFQFIKYYQFGLEAFYLFEWQLFKWTPITLSLLIQFDSKGLEMEFFQSNLHLNCDFKFVPDLNNYLTFHPLSPPPPDELRQRAREVLHFTVWLKQCKINKNEENNVVK
jgi:hypothetical protein